jgi:hypothetical protein
MVRTIAVMLTAAAMVCLAGCGGPEGGVVRGTVGSPRLGYAPDIQFTSYDDQLRSLRREADPIMIVVFAEPPGYNCCGVLGQLAYTADQLRPWAVTIVQVSVPTPECSYGPGCDECEVWEENLVTLCDSKRIAWRSYDRPAPHTAFLVDDNSRIVGRGGLEDLDALVRQAKVLAAEAADRDEALYIGD